MFVKRISIKLSTDELERAIAEIKAYRAEIQDSVNALVGELVNEGVNVCKAEIVSLGAVDTLDLLGSIEGIFDAKTGKGIIRASSGHAAYVEFGTGIVGESSPLPQRPSSWVYDVNGHGRDGWWYMDESRGYKRWTAGMQPRPFMYNTLLELSKIANERLKEKYNG